MQKESLTRSKKDVDEPKKTGLVAYSPCETTVEWSAKLHRRLQYAPSLAVSHYRGEAHLWLLVCVGVLMTTPSRHALPFVVSRPTDWGVCDPGTGRDEKSERIPGSSSLYLNICRTPSAFLFAVSSVLGFFF